MTSPGRARRERIPRQSRRSASSSKHGVVCASCDSLLKLIRLAARTPATELAWATTADNECALDDGDGIGCGAITERIDLVNLFRGVARVCTEIRDVKNGRRIIRAGGLSRAVHIVDDAIDRVGCELRVDHTARPGQVVQIGKVAANLTHV